MFCLNLYDDTPEEETSFVNYKGGTYISHEVYERVGAEVMMVTFSRLGDNQR